MNESTCIVPSPANIFVRGSRHLWTSNSLILCSAVSCDLFLFTSITIRHEYLHLSESLMPASTLRISKPSQSHHKACAYLSTLSLHHQNISALYCYSEFRAPANRSSRHDVSGKAVTLSILHVQNLLLSRLITMQIQKQA